MKIKSLLIGSAAALAAAVTGAKAADPIVIPEPEPMEYVRICDVYGAGFFYIPGTETCLKISGYVWYQVGADSSDGLDFGDTPPYFVGQLTATPGDDGWHKYSRARVNFDARSETEWGTLQGYIRFQGQSFNGLGADGNVAMDQGWLSIGGLRMGYSESAWAFSPTAGAAQGGSHSFNGMYYGYQQRQFIQYNFAGANGFFGVVSLEDDAYAGEGYVPDVVAKFGINQGWGALWAAVGYDEFRNPTDVASDAGWAAQAGLHLNVPNMPGSSFRLIGYYADSDNAYGAGSALANPAGAGTGTLTNSEWSVMASYHHQFTPTFGASIAAQYFSDLYIPTTAISSGYDAWGAELSLVWMPVTNLEFRSEIHYDDIGNGPLGNPDGAWAGFLRVTRYFGDQ